MAACRTRARYTVVAAPPSARDARSGDSPLLHAIKLAQENAMRFPHRLLPAASVVTIATALAAGGLAAQTSPTGQNAPAVRLTGVVYAQFEYWASDTLGHTSQFDVT